MFGGRPIGSCLTVFRVKVELFVAHDEVLRTWRLLFLMGESNPDSTDSLFFQSWLLLAWFFSFHGVIIEARKTTLLLRSSSPNLANIAILLLTVGNNSGEISGKLCIRIHTPQDQRL
jgi:hypothetical protein